MYVISCHGLDRAHPANTIAAFASALSAKCDGLQTEVQLSADQKAVLYQHRLTPDGTRVENLDCSMLRQRVGYIVPTLNEAFFAFPSTFWNLELKTPTAWPVVYHLIRAHNMEQQVLLTSKWHDLMLTIAQTQNEIECGLLIAHRPISLPAFLHYAFPCPLLRTLVWDYAIVDKMLLFQACQLGFRNYIYGASTLCEHTHCCNMPLNGLLTEYPEYLGLTLPHALQ